MTERPAIEACADAAQFRQWYYLKSELVAFARAKGLRTSGGKFEIADRIAHWIETGEAMVEPKAPKVVSTFDWHSEVLTSDTIITDSYKNTQNVRRFMQEHMGAGFKFSIPLMDWARANVGATLADLAQEASRIAAAKAAGAKIPDQPHNQYNAYTRAYFAQVPDGTAAQVRALWALRRARPGPYVFHPNDLDLLDDA